MVTLMFNLKLLSHKINKTYKTFKLGMHFDSMRGFKSFSQRHVGIAQW